VISFNLGGEKLKSVRFYFGVLFLLIGFFGVIIPSFAQTTFDESAIILGDTPASETPVGDSSILVMLRMVLVLALAALAIYGVVFFVKRISRPRESPNTYLKVLARVPLSSDSFAAVVSLGAKAWLVGGGSGGINLISEVEDAESVETLLIEDANKNAETRRFFDFRSLLRFGRDGKNPSSQQGNALTEKLRQQRERLKGL